MPAPYAVSSDLVSAWPAKSLDVAQYIDNYLPLLAMPQNAQTGTTYVLAATDITKLVTLSNGSPVAVTLPLESTVAWPTFTQLRLLNLGAGLVTIAGAVGVTITGSPLTLATSRSAILVKTGTNQWTIIPYGLDPGLTQVTPTGVANGTLVGGAVTFSAVSSVSLNGIFSSTFDNYRILVRMIGSTSALPTMRLRAAGTDASGANYDYQYLQGSASGVSAARTTGATGQEVATIGGTDYTWLTFEVASPFAAATTQFSIVSTQFTSAIILGGYSGRHSLSTSYDGVSLIANTGNITGTARVYGYRN